ncbi:hypothetical protein [Hydrogenophaga sp.]|uniref:hypothetical protein n=1 Tax=Hydrogenophaga sp. TaxID=1904254 RepID=UPI0027202231|nr:hypothetical protein [Hydrogenophaga sp.]MDO8905967.1 hypothetical protein [Hydrogenophaga sp.]
MPSHSVKCKPNDSRCRYWAKIVRAEQSLPLPAEVQGANDIPSPYLRRGEEELMAGDVLFEGEANHHRRTDRGWTYAVSLALPDGRFLCLTSGFGAQKLLLKEQGMAPEQLKGAGDVAAMVRIAHGMRLGLSLTEDCAPQQS